MGWMSLIKSGDGAVGPCATATASTKASRPAAAAPDLAKRSPFISHPRLESYIGLWGDAVNRAPRDLAFRTLVPTVVTPWDDRGGASTRFHSLEETEYEADASFPRGRLVVR